MASVENVKRLGRHSDEFIESAKPGNMFLISSPGVGVFAHEHIPVTNSGGPFGSILLDCSMPLLYIGAIKMGILERRYLNFLASTQNGLQKVVWLEDISLRGLTRYKQ